MRTLLALLVAFPLVAATPKPELLIPCDRPTVSPSETMAVEGDVVVFVLGITSRPCPYSLSNITPDVITLGTPNKDPNGNTYLNVVALAPGEGIIMMTSTGFGNVTTTRQVAAIHVDTCAAGSHTIQLLPEYNAVPKTEVSITADVRGSYPRGLNWFVNGVFIFDGPTLKYTPLNAGVYHLELRGDSACGIVSAKSELVVGGRGRAVRRR